MQKYAINGNNILIKFQNIEKCKACNMSIKLIKEILSKIGILNNNK